MGEAEGFRGGSLRVGVIGVGVMGSNHARVLAELPGVKLVGVADPDRKRCDQVARFASQAIRHVSARGEPGGEDPISIDAGPMGEIVDQRADVADVVDVLRQRFAAAGISRVP